MNWFAIIVGSLLELAALVVIIRLWRQKGRYWGSKVIWTGFLLFPFFGLLLYGFLATNPDSQADHTETNIQSDGGASF